MPFKKRTLTMIKNIDGKPACQGRNGSQKTINSDRQSKMNFKRYMTECAVITQVIGSNVAVVVVVVWTKKNATIFLPQPLVRQEPDLAFKVLRRYVVNTMERAD